MQSAFINAIGTAVPPYDIHREFVAYAPSLLKDEKTRWLFEKMVERAQIEHRFSFLDPAVTATALDRQGFYRRGDFPDTQARMRFFTEHAFGLACKALDDMDFTARKDGVTHVIAVSCTGFYAPGLDLQIVEQFGLAPTVERTFVGFMGCNAAFNALKLARHIVRSQPEARVLVVNLELCTIHLQETDDLEQVLCFLIFADGCSAALVSAEPIGIEMTDFHSVVMPDSAEQITWHIGQLGFDMHLSGRVPRTIARGLPQVVDTVLSGCPVADLDLWAVHPGGRSVLDAVEYALRLDGSRLLDSREVLRRFGNMSSATVMFVLKAMMARANRPALGCAMAFGPGLTAETMLFRTA